MNEILGNHINFICNDNVYLIIVQIQSIRYYIRKRSIKKINRKAELFKYVTCIIRSYILRLKRYNGFNTLELEQTITFCGGRANQCDSAALKQQDQLCGFEIERPIWRFRGGSTIFFLLHLEWHYDCSSCEILTDI